MNELCLLVCVCVYLVLPHCVDETQLCMRHVMWVSLFMTGESLSVVMTCC